ncbi:MAG TPA: EamA family transporter [Anaerolineales bacterium]|nr:EamA family transporter [Anaerolineales bacterium]
MTSLTERRKAILFLILAAALWSTAGVFVKALDWGPVSILAGRGLFTSIVFLLYLRRLPAKWSRWMLLAAGASIATQFLFIISTKLTTAANSIFLQYTAPIYVVMLAYWLLREKPSRYDWIAMGIIFLGMLLFFGDQISTEGFYGNILAVISGVTAAVMMVSFRAQKDSSPEDSVLLASLLIAIFGFPSILKESWTITAWLSIAYLGVIQIGLAFILFTKGIKHIPALEANLIGTLEPILSPVWVFLFLGERMGAFALLGGLVVLVGVIINAIASTQVDRE